MATIKYEEALREIEEIVSRLEQDVKSILDNNQ